MHTHKKLLVGLSLLVAVFFFIIGGHKAFALTKSDLDSATYKIISNFEIDGIINGSTIKFRDRDVFDDKYNFKPDSNQFCNGTAYQTSSGSLADSLKGITLGISVDNLTNNTAPAIVNLDYKDTNGNCLNYQSRLTFTKQSSGSYTAAASPAGTGGDGPVTCNSQFDVGFEWMLCPALGMADNLAGYFNSFVEKQLSVCTGVSSTTDQSCEGNILTNEVERAWTVFRYIATALLVIIMLVMVISQALSLGPFDAYTVRKVLPRIVAAVILIQISWIALKWFIDVSNDLGQGIQTLMYAPFGGSDNLSLSNIMGAGFENATGGSNAGGDATATFIFLSAATLAIANLPGLLMIALFVVISLFIAFFVLILRKILIVMLVIIAPIALVAWILPGTERYWKTWSTNFTKLLLMFPLIMALIAAGRIFAHITATTATAFHPPQLAVAHLGPLPVPYIADVTSLAGLVIVLVAFFAPYFLLPKTFGWGGQLMGAAGAAVAANRITRGMQERSKGLSEDLTKRYRGNLANRYRTTAPGEGTLEGASRRQRLWAAARRGALRTGAGHALPTERKTRALLAQGFEYKEDLVKGKQGLIATDYNEVLNKTHDVAATKKYIRDKYGHGNMEFDKKGNFTGVKDDYTERAFYNWVIDTKSGMELGDDEWRTAGGAKPDLAKTPGFLAALHADGGRYAQVGQWFPVFQPFYSEIGGGPRPADYLKGGKRYNDKVDPDTGAVEPGRQARNANEAQLFADDERFVKWLANMNDPNELRTVRPEMYEMMANVDAGLGGKSQSAAKLKTLLEENAATGAGQYIIRPLAGGEKSARKHIDAMFGDRYLEGLLGIKPGGGPPPYTAPGGPGSGGAGPGPSAGGPPGPRPSPGPAGDPRFATDSAGVTKDTEVYAPTGVSTPDIGGASAGLTADQISEAVARGTRMGHQPPGGRTIATEGGGIINIEHEPRVIRPQPGETVSQGGVIIPPGTRSTEVLPEAESGEDETSR